MRWGEEVRAARLDLGLTAREAALETGISLSRWYEYEARILRPRGPGTARANQIEGYLGLAPEGAEENQ